MQASLCHSIFPSSRLKRFQAVHVYRNISVLLLFVIGCLPLSLYAQKVQTLTLEQAIKLGTEQSKALKVSSSKIVTSEARSKQYAAAAIPNVSLNGSYTRLSNNITPFIVQLPGAPEGLALNPQILNQYTSGVSVTEPIFAGFRIKYALESARYVEEATRLDYEKDKSEVVLNIAAAYLNLYKIDVSKRLVQENIRQLNEQLTNVKNFEKQGLAIGNEVLRTQLQLSNIELSQIDITNSLNVANYNLNIMLGLPTDTQIQVDTNAIFSAKQLQTFDEYLQQAVNSRSDLKALDIRGKSVSTQVNMARANYYPTVNLFGNYFYNRPNQRVFPQQDKFKDTWSAGITLSYNLSNLFTNKNQVAEATSLALQTQTQYEQLSDNVKMEVNQNYLAVVQSQQKIEVARRSVAQAAENYRTTQSRYGNGVALLTDVLDANVLLLQANINYISARADAELAYQRLLKATGANTSY